MPLRKNHRLPVAVIGAGLAGLTAANYLRRQGVPVVLYEAGKQLAGLAQSFKDDDGFSYDFGAHFITNRLAAAIGVSSQCRDVRYYGESVLLGGRTYGYPFGLMRVPRFLASGIASRLPGRERDPQNAADWFRARYGKALADEVAIPLTEAWSGAGATELSPAVGASIPSSIGRTLWLKLASRVKRRAVSCGYSREMPESPNVWHVYPMGGVGILCQQLAEGLRDAIRLESPVEEITVEEGRAVTVRARGRAQEVSAVISTAPYHALAKLVKGTDALQPLARFRYRPMVFVNMRFRGRGLLRDVVMWTPEKEFPFFRLTETTLSMPWLAPEGKTLITVDIGCNVGDETWSMDEDRLGELCLQHMSALIPDARERYMGCRVLRTPIAYPIFLNEYEEDRQRFSVSTGIENLHSVGRNGEFSHIFMEDVYWRTRKKARQLTLALNKHQRLLPPEPALHEQPQQQQLAPVELF